MVDVSADVAGQLLTKQYRSEKIFGKQPSVNLFRAQGSVRSCVVCFEASSPRCMGSESLACTTLFRPVVPCLQCTLRHTQL